MGSTLADLAPGARVATGAARRRAQLANLRPDLSFVELRGNIATRHRRGGTGSVGAVVVAAAALERLERHLAGRRDPLADRAAPPGRARARSRSSAVPTTGDGRRCSRDRRRARATGGARPSGRCSSRWAASCSLPVGGWAVADGPTRSSCGGWSRPPTAGSCCTPRGRGGRPRGARARGRPVAARRLRRRPALLDVGSGPGRRSDDRLSGRRRARRSRVSSPARAPRSWRRADVVVYDRLDRPLAARARAAPARCWSMRASGRPGPRGPESAPVGRPARTTSTRCWSRTAGPAARWCG